jgi:hypothetical protein
MNTLEEILEISSEHNLEIYASAILYHSEKWKNLNIQQNFQQHRCMFLN